jgi:hypothetical protein
VKLYAIYDRPHDSPDGFLVRVWHCDIGFVSPGGVVARDLKTLEEARAVVRRKGCANIGRAPEDDPKIVEVWL